MVRFTRVVLSGGGIKGIAQLGKLHSYYEKHQITHETTTHYAGTSIGSVICTLLSIGYLPIEIFQKLYEKGGDLLERPENKTSLDIYKNFGFLSMDTFLEFFQQMIFDKLVSEDQKPHFSNSKSLTLGELYKLTGKELYIVGTNVTSGEEKIFHHSLTPDIKIIKAVKISCALPIIFERVHYKGEYYVDGALVNGCPLNLVDNGTNGIVCIVTPGSVLNVNELIGVIPYMGEFISYIYNLTIIPVNKNMLLNTSKRGSNTTLVTIHLENQPLLSFNISSEQKMALWLEGQKANESTEPEFKELENVNFEAWDDPF